MATKNVSFNGEVNGVKVSFDLSEDTNKIAAPIGGMGESSPFPNQDSEDFEDGDIADELSELLGLGGMGESSDFDSDNDDNDLVSEVESDVESDIDNAESFDEIDAIEDEFDLQTEDAVGMGLISPDQAEQAKGDIREYVVNAEANGDIDGTSEGSSDDEMLEELLEELMGDGDNEDADPFGSDTEDEDDQEDDQPFAEGDAIAGAEGAVDRAEEMIEDADTADEVEAVREEFDLEANTLASMGILPQELAQQVEDKIDADVSEREQVIQKRGRKAKAA